MRTVLIGAVESSLVALRTMSHAGEPPAAVVTLPLDRAGRHSDFVDLRPEAARAGVSVVEAAQANAPEALARIRSFEPDHVFVIGWSQILGRELLSIPRGGTIGYHPAALPELRGRAVIPWTVLTRRKSTGSTLFWVDDGVDTGDILAQEVFDVAHDETARSLYAKHMGALERILARAVRDLSAGRRPRTPQDHSRATVCAKRTAEDGVIDWSRSAPEIWTLIRAVGDPYPGAFTFAGPKKLKLIVREAELVQSTPYIGLPGQVQELGAAGALVTCGDGGHVRLREVELEGGGRCVAKDILKMHERLGLSEVDLWKALAAERR